METLPFWDMEPRNDLVSSGKAFCLSRPGRSYALYLPEGGEVEVRLEEGIAYENAWWNPESGKDGKLQNRGGVDGGTRKFAAPVQKRSSPGPGDWALRIEKRDS